MFGGVIIWFVVFKFFCSVSRFCRVVYRVVMLKSIRFVIYMDCGI